MEIFTTKVKTNLSGVLQMTQMINGIMMTGDNAANQILVELYNGLNRVTIDPETKIVGYFIRSDGYTLEEDGVIEDNMAKVIIPEAAYQVSGTLSIAIRMMSGKQNATYRGYYKTVIRRGYYSSTSETNEFVEVTDASVTEGPNGEAVGEFIFTANEFVQVTDENITEGPNGEPVVEKEFETWATKIVIAALSCFVQITETSSLLDVYHHIPDVQELLQYLEEFDVWNSNANTAENARIAAENQRIQAENTRNTNENARGSNEATRISNETARKNNETTRQNQETTRQNQEAARQTAQAQRNAAIDNMTVGAVQLNPDTDPTATITTVDGHKHIQFGMPEPVGVEDAHVTRDHHLHLLFNNGDEYESESLRGPKGEDGRGFDVESYDPLNMELVVNANTMTSAGAFTDAEIDEIFAGL